MFLLYYSEGCNSCGGLFRKGYVNDLHTTICSGMLGHRSPTDGDLLPDPSRYRFLVGSLVYLAVTRPDISYPVHILSQFVSAPTTIHYSHLLRVLRYLRGTITRCLFFPRSSSLQLQCYSDAMWASDPTDRRLLSAYCVFLGGSLIAC
jgi:hypothetical protein